MHTWILSKYFISLVFIKVSIGIIKFCEGFISANLGFSRKICKIEWRAKLSSFTVVFKHNFTDFDFQVDHWNCRRRRHAVPDGSEWPLTTPQWPHPPAWKHQQSGGYADQCHADTACVPHRCSAPILGADYWPEVKEQRSEGLWGRFKDPRSAATTAEELAGELGSIFLLFPFF